MNVSKSVALVERLQGAQAAADPTASADFESLRVLRKKFSRGGLPANRTPEDDARLVVFYVLRALLDLLAEFARRVRRGERLRLVVTEQPSMPGRMVVEVLMESVNQEKGRGL